MTDVLVDLSGFDDLTVLKVLAGACQDLCEPWHVFEGVALEDMSAKMFQSPEVVRWRQQAQEERRAAFDRVLASSLVDQSMDDLFPESSAYLKKMGAPGLGSVRKWATRRRDSLISG